MFRGVKSSEGNGGGKSRGEASARESTCAMGMNVRDKLRERTTEATDASLIGRWKWVMPEAAEACEMGRCNRVSETSRGWPGTNGSSTSMLERGRDTAEAVKTRAEREEATESVGDAGRWSAAEGKIDAFDRRAGC